MGTDGIGFEHFQKVIQNRDDQRFKKKFQEILELTDIDRRTRIYQLITNERARQDMLHPNRMVAHAPLAALGEEFGEVCRDVFEENEENLVRELVETAAVCVRWLEELEV